MASMGVRKSHLINSGALEAGSMSKVLLLEFNEICPPLLKRWMEQGKLPNFSALHYSSQVFTSVADASEPDYLEPWIQWYSIHTGLSYDELEFVT
jgi:hypothetical protein